ncbi:MAG: tetrahydrofolate dehydrogenase/cyclohydrolase catalytic domain-containing protein [Acidimicrobiales bacterium]
MTAVILDGAALAEQIRSDVSVEVAEMRARGIVPGLGTVLVGDDPASSRYVELKHEDAAAIGIASFGEHLPENSSMADVISVVRRFNADPAIDAFLVQVPLPSHLNDFDALVAIDSQKDVDGLHPVNLGKLVIGVDGPLPCTPAGIVELLAHHEVPVEGRNVVILGRGLTIGRPLALLMSSKRPHCNAAVTALHTGVADLGEYTRRADVIVAAVGRAGLVTKEMVKPGAAVVGAGTSFEGRRLLSDVAEDVAEVAGFITPRIGGVGPMTRAMLLRNAVRAARRRLA